MTNNTQRMNLRSFLRIPASSCAFIALFFTTATGFTQTVLTPKMQARFGAKPENLGKFQDSILPQETGQVSQQIGFVAGEYPEEFRNIAIFKLDDTGLTAPKVVAATLEVVATHQLGAKTPRIAVAQVLTSSGASDFIFTNYDMYAEPEGELLLKDGEWTTTHSLDITKILKSALLQSDESRGLVFRIWLVSDGTEDLADYDSKEIKATSLGKVEVAIHVEKAP